MKITEVIKDMDFWGTTTSLLCAVHCAVLPLLLSAGAIGSHTWLNNILFEIIVLGLTTVFVFFSIIKPYLNTNDHKTSFVLALLGLFCILTHHLFPFGNSLIIVLGGILVAAAHLIKLVFIRHSH